MVLCLPNAHQRDLVGTSISTSSSSTFKYSSTIFRSSMARCPFSMNLIVPSRYPARLRPLDATLPLPGVPGLPSVGKGSLGLMGDCLIFSSFNPFDVFDPFAGGLEGRIFSRVCRGNLRDADSWLSFIRTSMKESRD